MAAYNSVDVLLLAAHPLELEPFRGALGGDARAVLGGRCVVAASVGVGMPAAGAGTMEALLREPPRVAVLVGSYGTYTNGSEFTPGRLLVPTSIHAIDEAVLSGRSEVPEPMTVRLETDAALSEALAGSHVETDRAPIATTFGITTDAALATWLGARSGCAGENLEALAVALACRQRSVPFAAVLACTNEVGTHGRAQWLRHHRLAAERTAKRVLAWLGADR